MKIKSSIKYVCIFIIILSLVIGYAIYKATYENKLNEIKNKISGTWHTYKSNSKYNEIIIKINEDILTDENNERYQMKISPFNNSFVANGIKYNISKDYSSISSNGDTYTKPKLDQTPSKVIKIENIKWNSTKGYATCSATLVNGSKHTYRYIEIRGGFINPNYKMFDTKDYTITDLKPGETKKLELESNNFLIDNEKVGDTWKVQNCEFELKEAKT